MSKPAQEQKDIFSVCKKNVDKFFSEIEKSTPRYQQSVQKQQQDYLNAWKSVINSAISLEQEYATKAGFNVDVPEATLSAIRELTQQAIKAYEAQNKVVMDTAEATKQAFNAFNENTKSFASLNRNIMGFLISSIQQKSKT
ncbi:MAG: hypothetical protein IH780_02715 [Thaumarchaeota archaeon]|nr:hypothetical protein [Nitrososphaerota archaeon]MCH8860730.1 hypothetical protein [Nitrososphaerota archaeon]